MSREQLRVVVTGVEAGAEPATVAARLAVLLGRSRRELTLALDRGVPEVVAREVSPDDARRLVGAMVAAGASCSVERDPRPASLQTSGPPAGDPPSGTVEGPVTVRPAGPPASAPVPLRARRGPRLPRIGMAGMAFAAVLATAALVILLEHRRQSSAAELLEVANDLLAVVEEVAGVVEASPVYSERQELAASLRGAGDGDGFLAALVATVEELEAGGGSGPAGLAALERELEAGEVELDALDELAAVRGRMSVLRTRSAASREARERLDELERAVDRFLTHAARPSASGDAAGYVIGYDLLRGLSAAGYLDAVEAIRGVRSRGDRELWRAAEGLAEERIGRCEKWREGLP